MCETSTGTGWEGSRSEPNTKVGSFLLLSIVRFLSVEEDVAGGVLVHRRGKSMIGVSEINYTTHTTTHRGSSEALAFLAPKRAQQCLVRVTDERSSSTQAARWSGTSFRCPWSGKEFR